MAGVIVMTVALLRLGIYIKYIPLPVTIGFTAGIAVIIAASQISELLGLTIAHEPSALVPALEPPGPSADVASSPSLATMTGGAPPPPPPAGQHTPCAAPRAALS